MITENESGLGDMSDQERNLEDRAALALDIRRDAGLEGLVGNLDAVIIATEPDHLVPAVYELSDIPVYPVLRLFSNRSSRAMC